MISEDIINGIIMEKWEVRETEIRDFHYSDSLKSYSIAFNFGYPKYSYNTSLYICEINNETILWRYVQDPDNSEYQEFKKTSKISLI
jgi:hypothetical protein